MANFIEKLGLEFLTEDEKHVMGLWNYIAEKGNPITGYYGTPYLNHHFGGAQVILRTIKDDDSHRLSVTGMDTHASGASVWNVRLSGMNIQRKDADIMERRCVVKRDSDGGGMAVVNIVNADVLPSFEEDDVIKLQMIAFPSFIEYFKDEDEYVEAQPEGRRGKFLIADGTMFPTGFFRNRNPESSEFESDENLDDFMLIRGTVKKLYHGVAKFEDEEFNAYIGCIIDTELGELEIVHTIDDVAEEHRDNIRIGAIVNGVFTLSGDAAIYEYENGFVLDEKNNLAILRSTLLGADAKRMQSVFSDDATYFAEYNSMTYTGRDEIIDRLNYVTEAASKKYYAHLATIVSVDEGETALAFSPGQRCIILASGEPTNYESIAFIEMDESGHISKLVTTAEPRYHFHIDEKPVSKSVLDEIEKPESASQLILNRACYHCLIDSNEDYKALVAAAYDDSIFRNNAERMIESMPSGKEQETIENLFGYLFAKAIEAEYSNLSNEGVFKTRFVVGYTPSDAWEGCIETPLSEELDSKIKSAMVLGKQFAKDFAHFHPYGSDHNEQYEEDLVTALLVAQQVGKMYAPKCMAE